MLTNFDSLDDEQIEDYISTGEPMDKAGAYGIQAKGSAFVKKIEGCYFNVVGLPLNLLSKMLKEAGIKK
jgi:septum formation protein